MVSSPSSSSSGGAGAGGNSSNKSSSPIDTIYRMVPGLWKFQTTLNQFVSYIPAPPPLDRGTPRKILIVTSHPVPESFSLAIAKTVENVAKEQGHQVQRIDLGLDGFQPVLVSRERQIYFDEKLKNESHLPTDVRKYLQKLRWCDTIFFVYPTWWMNTPANLKGFFDRTMLRHQTWNFPDSNAGVEASSSATSLLSSVLPQGLSPGLENIQQVFGISTYGASRPIVTLAGDNGRNMISTAIMPIFSKDCTIRWHGLYNMDFQTNEGRSEFLDEVKNMVKAQL
jgi:putative NADPH-quinone reductase